MIEDKAAPRYCRGVGDEPVLDEETVDGLRRLGDDVLAEIVRLWFDNLEPNLTAMREAMAADDSPALSAAAHTLRGSAANVGAARLSAACAALESTAKNGDDRESYAALMETVSTEATAAHVAMAGLAEEPSG